MEKEAAIKTLDSETRIFPFILSIPSYRVAVPQLFENLSGQYPQCDAFAFGKRHNYSTTAEMKGSGGSLCIGA